MRVGKTIFSESWWVQEVLPDDDDEEDNDDDVDENDEADENDGVDDDDD